MVLIREAAVDLLAAVRIGLESKPAETIFTLASSTPFWLLITSIGRRSACRDSYPVGKMTFSAAITVRCSSCSRSNRLRARLRVRPACVREVRDDPNQVRRIIESVSMAWPGGGYEKSNPDRNNEIVRSIPR